MGFWDKLLSQNSWFTNFVGNFVVNFVEIEPQIVNRDKVSDEETLGFLDQPLSKSGFSPLRLNAFPRLYGMAKANI